jgi:hypothetical protein
MSAQVYSLFGSVSLLDEDDLPNVPQQWAVKGLVPDKGFGVIYGPSKSGKTFLTLDLLAHLRHGQAWFGRRVPIPRHVVYVPLEGRAGIPKRVQAWRQMHDNNKTGIKFVYQPINLRNKFDRDNLVAAIRAAGMQSCVLCIDTLAQAGPGVDENNSEGMGELIAIFQDLQQQLDGLVLVLHHTGKDVDRGMRGWSGLLGALDFAIECQFAQDKASDKFDRSFRVDKQKDGEDGLSFNFRIEPVVLGMDNDGDPIVSLAVKQKLLAPVQPVPPSEHDDRHDKLVWRWINDEVTAGRRPSGRSLEGQRVARHPEMGQKELRDAIARLIAAGRLAHEGAGKNQSLRAVEVTPGGGHT